MGRVDDYRGILHAMPADRWDAYLASNSRLPGPRGNIELALAVAEEASPTHLRRYAASEDEFQAVCGAVGLGRLLADGDETAAAGLRTLATDPRWRIREGVAMGLQRLGDSSGARLLAICRQWVADPSPLVQRAVVAGICEPRLLTESRVASAALDLLDEVTARVESAPATERRRDDFRVLRKALGYCWSVAVAAGPESGFGRLARWAASADRDVRWIVAENLKKNRLRRADPDGWARLQAGLGRAAAQPPPSITARSRMAN